MKDAVDSRSGSLRMTQKHVCPIKKNYIQELAGGIMEFRSGVGGKGE